MRRSMTVLLGLVILCGGVSAMIQTLPLEELVAGSDLILIASLKSSRETGKTADGLSRVENLMVVAAVLKGDARTGAELQVATVGGFEDEVVFAPRQKGVLFLKKAGDGAWEVNNLVQGWWPLGRDDAPAGMGTGIGLDRLKEVIRSVAEGKLPASAPAAPPEQL